MSFETDSKLFASQVDGCGAQLAEGRFLIAPLQNCATLPTIYTLTPTAAVALSLVPANISVNNTGVSATEVLYIAKGRILRFGAVEVVTTAQYKLVGVGPHLINVEAVPTAITTADTAPVVSALEIISLTTMPLNYSAQTENSDRLSSGIQSDMDVTKISAQMDIEGFVRSDDAGFWTNGYGFDSATGVVTLYGLTERANSKLSHWGPLQFHSCNFTNQSASLQKFSSSVVFKPQWFRSRHADYLTPAEKTALNNIRTQFGLKAV